MRMTSLFGRSFMPQRNNIARGNARVAPKKSACQINIAATPCDYSRSMAAALRDFFDRFFRG
jgi:hypothetical protein